MGAERKESITDMPSVLVAVLERWRWTPMRVLLIIFALLLLTVPAYAFQIPFTEIKILESSEKPAPINNRVALVLVEPTLNVEKIVEDRGIVDSVTRFIGVNKNGDRNITVYHNGKLLAFYKEGTKFDSIQVHETCLRNQYGTEAWYTCERRYQ